MKSGALFSLAIAFLIGLIAFAGAAFTVDQTEQALVLRFGEPVAGRGLITTPGLHFKLPLVENIVFFDNRNCSIRPLVKNFNSTPQTCYSCSNYNNLCIHLFVLDKLF